MSSNNYAAPLQLELKPSRRLGAFLWTVHIAGLAVLFALSISLWLKGPLAGAVLFSLVVELDRARRFVRLLWSEEGEWNIQIGELPSISGELLPNTLISRFGALLIFRLVTGRRVSVVALPDAFTGDGLRQLRVRLRIEPRILS